MAVHRIVHISTGEDWRDCVIMLDNGTRLDNVKGLSVTMEAGEVTEVNLSFIALPTSIQGQVGDVTLICPVCGREETHRCDDPSPRDEGRRPGGSIFSPGGTGVRPPPPPPRGRAKRQRPA